MLWKLSSVSLEKVICNVNVVIKALYAMTQSVIFPDWYFAKDAAKFDLNEDLSRYYPQISDSSIKGNFIDIDENCIGFEPTSIPSSTIDLFVYTENIREIYKLSS